MKDLKNRACDDKRVLFVGSSIKCDEDSCAFWMTGNKSGYPMGGI